ncbi:MAG: glutamine amidotransferase [Gammaproteobacteria bacterium]
MKTALAIRHVSYEDLGSFASVLESRGYAVEYRDAGVDDLDALDPLAPDLLIVLGGSIGVAQVREYPYLTTEIELTRRRIEAGHPTLGICLGAQIMARALGSRVYTAEKMELGWAPLALTHAGRDSPLARLADIPLLHWHGDTFELPADAICLAATPDCAHQAFAYGDAALALQFHPEVSWPGFERWLIGGVRALVAKGFDIPTLREESARCCAALAPAAALMLDEWLEHCG